jgi:hypothetical protein
VVASLATAAPDHPSPVSLYVDDLIMFIGLTPADMGMAKEILLLFKGSLGLGYNVAKCQVVVIRCEADQVDQAVQAFLCQVVTIPIRYLGMPLSVSKLPKSALQPLLDDMADMLLMWHDRLMHQSGCLTLIKSNWLPSQSIR